MQAFTPALTPLPLGNTVISLLVVTISGGSSMYLRPLPTHTLPCVELPSALRLCPGELLIIQSLTLFPVLLKYYTDSC